MSIRDDLLVSFKINGIIRDIEISQEDVVLYNNLVDDDEFTLKYLNILIASEEIRLDGDLEEIYRLDSNGDLEAKIFPVKHKNKVEHRDKWYEPETSLLIEKYEIYIEQVGHSMLYPNKKCMWEQIANDINKKFEMKKTAVQVENRFKTLLKRKEFRLKYRRTGEEDDNNLKGELRVLSSEKPQKRKFDSICNSPPTEEGMSLVETLTHFCSEEKAAENRRREEILILLEKHKAEAERRRKVSVMLHEKTKLLRKKEYPKTAEA